MQRKIMQNYFFVCSVGVTGISFLMQNSPKHQWEFYIAIKQISLLAEEILRHRLMKLCCTIFHCVEALLYDLPSKSTSGHCQRQPFSLTHSHTHFTGLTLIIRLSETI